MTNQTPTPADAGSKAADIVKRLRDIDHMSVDDSFLSSHLYHQAADEIIRLRAENAELQRKLGEAVKALETISKAPYQFCAAEVVTANKALSSIRQSAGIDSSGEG